MADIIHDEEVVLCEKTFSTVIKKSPWLIVAGIILFIIGVFLLIMSFSFPKYLIIIGIIVVIASIFLFVIGLRRYLKSSNIVQLNHRLVLTNKRIISTRYSCNAVSEENNIILKHITDFTLTVVQIKNRYLLNVSTENDNYSFVLDDREMYDTLAKAI